MIGGRTVRFNSFIAQFYVLLAKRIKAFGCNPNTRGFDPLTGLNFKGELMADKKKKQEEAVKEIVKKTPHIYSVNELIGLAEDDEDHLIYERRCRKSGW